MGRSRIDGSARCLIIADGLALIVLFVALPVAAAEGVDSGALIVGVPPACLAVMSSIAFGVAHKWRLRWPLTAAVAICAVAIVAAMVSFITPLLLATVPVSGLLIAACAVRLGSPDVAVLRAGKN